MLVQPVPPRQFWPRGIFRSMHVPTGIAYVAAALQRAGHEVKVHIREEQFYKCDADWDAADAALLNLLREFHPDMVGMSVLTPWVPETAWIAAQTKTICGTDTLTVAGGVHPTVLGREMLETIPELDVVVVGEGEQTVVDLAAGRSLPGIAGIIHRQNGAPVHATMRPPVWNLDELAPIDYGMFDMAYYTAPSPWLIIARDQPADVTRLHEPVPVLRGASRRRPRRAVSLGGFRRGTNANGARTLSRARDSFRGRHAWR